MDTSEHTSYLLTDAGIEDIGQFLGDDPDYIGLDIVTKYDSIKDKYVELTKVLARNPNAIGAQATRERTNNFRDILTDAGFNVWEARIRYVNNICYDMKYEVGMPYRVTLKTIKPIHYKDVAERKHKILEEMTKETDYTDALDHWVRISEERVPLFKYASVDIEVLPETPTTMPNAIMANQPIIAASMYGSDGKKIVYLLKRPGVSTGEGKINVEADISNEEVTLIHKVFRLMNQYPFIITFNGDNFDLMYLYNRAIKLGINKKLIPVYILKKVAKLKNGVHIDLYPFIKNPSIQNYAFKEKYKNHTLEAVSQGLLNRGKIQLDKYMDNLTYIELANYCANDADLTYELCTFENNAMLNLILALTRMANLSIYQITRNKISDWVKSSMFYMMRKRNWLIPNEKDLLSRGEIQTVSKVKGKGYEGAIVRDPRNGIFFNVIVMDFQSLYPSQVKYRNIGFASINCPHESCKSATDNKVPGTTHWICKKVRSLEADVIGGLRDVRVLYYKREAKNKNNPLSKFYAILEQAIKVYVNAAYGVFGSTAFALFCPPVAESIAAYSRRDIMAVVDRATEIKADPFYGDTDSIFLNNPTMDQTKELKRFAHDTLKMDLDVDKVYRYGLFSTRKKNYLGVYKDGSVDIKGLTGKKKQVPQIIKEPFYKVLEVLKKVNSMDEYETAKSEIWNICNEYYKKIKNKQWDSMEQLAYNVRLSRAVDQYAVNAQHVKVAKMLQEMGQEVRGGDNVEFIKATTEEGVMPLLGANPEFVDIDNYLAELGTTMIQLLDPMDISWEEIEGVTTLDMFTGKTSSRILREKRLNT